MDGLNILKVLIFTIFSQLVQGQTECDYQICYEYNNCCNGYCCASYDSDTNVYELWWFWLILVLVFFHIVICCICMCRRRSARMRYKRIAEVQPVGYSSVTVSNQSQYTHVQPPQYYQQPTAPQQYPPQYQQPTAPQQYPPQYQQSNIPEQPPPPYQ